MSNKFIRKLSGFVEFDARDIAALERATSRSRELGPRKDLIREGDRPGPVFVMLDGWSMRYKILPNGSRQITAFLVPGDACDLHVSLLSVMDHSIQTISRAQVATIPRATMDDMMASYPNIARAMYVAQLVDEGVLRAWIVGLGRRSSIERVAHLMLELFLRRIGIEPGRENGVELPVSQVVLADAVGMTPVHINRVLQELRRSGIVDLRRGVLRIADLAALARVSGFDDNYLHKRLNRESLSVELDKH